MSECNSAYKMVLTYIRAFVGFLGKIVSSVHRYLLFYLFCFVRACSACWIEQKVIQNIGGKK